MLLDFYGKFSLSIIELIADGREGFWLNSQLEPLKESHDTETFLELECCWITRPRIGLLLLLTRQAVSCKSRCSFINRMGKYIEKSLRRSSKTTRPRQSRGGTRSTRLLNLRFACDQLKTVILTCGQSGYRDLHDIRLWNCRVVGNW